MFIFGFAYDERTWNAYRILLKSNASQIRHKTRELWITAIFVISTEGRNPCPECNEGSLDFSSLTLLEMTFFKALYKHMFSRLNAPPFLPCPFWCFLFPPLFQRAGSTLLKKSPIPSSPSLPDTWLPWTKKCGNFDDLVKSNPHRHPGESRGP